MTNHVPCQGHIGTGEALYFQSYEDEGYSMNLTIVSPYSLGIPSSKTAPSQVVHSIMNVDLTERETHQGAFAY